MVAGVVEWVSGDGEEVGGGEAYSSGDSLERNSRRLGSRLLSGSSWEAEGEEGLLLVLLVNQPISL